MELVSKKNFLLFLAALLVVALGYMAVSLSRRPATPAVQADPEVRKIETQSTSDDVNSIEKDLQDTDYTGIEKDLQNLDKELNTSY